MLGGLAGGLFAGGFAYVSPDQFSFAESIVFLTMSLLGGVASPIGSVIGTGLLILIPEWLRFLKSVPGLYLAIYGLSVILIIRYMPDGIWGFVNLATARWRAKAKVHAAGPALQLVPATIGGDIVLEVKGLVEIFRRPQGGRRCRYRGAARRRARADRAERLRQDHDAERALRPLQGDRRAG